MNVISETKRAAEVPSGMAAEEWDIRCELAACYQLADIYGFSDMAGTHISARVPGPDDHFLLNPYGYFFDEITASSLIKVDVEGNVISGKSDVLNYAGFIIHSAIHMARPELVCVMHSHGSAINGVGAQQHGLLPLTQKALLLTHFLRYHEFEGAAFNPGERERILGDLGDEGRVMVLRNHGALTAGRSVGEAFCWMYKLDLACQQQVNALAGGSELHALPDEVIQRTIEQGRKVQGPGGHSETGRIEWPGLIRKLERERGTGYRT